MQTIERGGYTREEILSVLHAEKNSRYVRFRYDLLDKNGYFKKTLSTVVDGEVSMSAFSTIKRTAKFKIKERYIPEHIERKTTRIYDYTFTDWASGTHTGTVNAGDSPFGGTWLRITTPNINALSTNQSTFGTTAWTSGEAHPEWKKWGSASNVWGYSGSQSLGGMAQYIKRTTTSSLGIETNNKPLSVTANEKVYLSFFFKPVNDSGGYFANPTYCYVMHNDGQGNVNISTYTVTNLGDGWFRYDGEVTVTRTDNVGVLIGWYTSTGTTGEVYIDNVYFGKTKPTWEAEWVSDEIDISDERNAIYVNSDLAFNKQTPAYATNVLQSRVSLDGGQTWTAWSTEGETAINGLTAGDDLTNARLQFKVTLSRRNISDWVGIDNLNYWIDAECDYLVPEQPEIDYLSDRIQPFMEIQMPDGNWIDFPLGVFILSTPTKRDEVNGVYREIEAYDGLVILDEDKFTSRFYLTAGTKYTDAVESILRSAGITRFNIEPKSATLATDMEFKIGTSKLEAINQLLQAINYTPIWVDANGYFVASQYVSPAERAVDYSYKDDELSVIYNGMEEELDLYGVPNVWVVTQSNPEKTPLVSTKTNDNPDSPTSTVNVGRNIVDFREVDDISDQETLDAYVDRIAFEASQVFGKLKFRTALMPFHEYADVIHVKYDALKIDYKFSETAWKMPLKAGAEMEHEVRRVVSI
jgi:hypothetical protein